MRKLFLVIIFIATLPITAWSMNDDEVILIYSELQGYLYSFGNVGIPKTELQNKLSDIREKVEKEISSNPNDPRLWVLLGENSLAFMYAYAEPGTKPSAEQWVKIEKHRKDFQVELKKGFKLELSNSPSQPHLPCELFNEWGNRLGTIESLLIMRRGLDKCSIESSIELDVRSSVATGMAKLGKLDEALAELDRIREVYKSMGQDPSRVDEYVPYVERLAREAVEKENPIEIKDAYAQADTYSAPKAVAVQQPIQQTAEPKKVEAPKVAKTSESDNSAMLWWLLGGGALLFGLIVLIRRKQS